MRESMSEKMKKWDRRFMQMATLVSGWSKDPSSGIGAVITDTRKRIISVGFNGFPAGTSDDPEIYGDRSRKYKRVLHAERNAILFAKQDLEGCNIYVWPAPPCAQCAAEIIQAGISRVLSVNPSEDFSTRWSEDLEETKKLFFEAGVNYRLCDNKTGDRAPNRSLLEKEIAEERKADFMPHVKEKVQNRIASGEPITKEEWLGMYTNSYERKLLIDLMDEETLLHDIKVNLENAGIREMGKYELPKHYNDAIERLYIHELIRRFENKIIKKIGEEE